MSLFIYPVMKSWVHAIQSHRCLVSTYIAQSADTHGSSLPDSASQVSPSGRRGIRTSRSSDQDNVNDNVTILTVYYIILSSSYLTSLL